MSTLEQWESGRLNPDPQGSKRRFRNPDNEMTQDRADAFMSVLAHRLRQAHNEAPEINKEIDKRFYNGKQDN